MSGIEKPSYSSKRQVALSISAFQDAWDVERKPDEGVEQLNSLGPEMLVGTDEELRARKQAQDRGVEEAAANGLLEEQVGNRRGILSRHVNAFRRATR